MISEGEGRIIILGNGIVGREAPTKRGGAKKGQGKPFPKRKGHGPQTGVTQVAYPANLYRK